MSDANRLDWTQIRRIAWKDYRRISGLGYAFVVFWGICLAYVTWSTYYTPLQPFSVPWSTTEIMLAISLTTLIYVLGWGAITFSAEHDDKTYPYLSTLPVTGKTVFYGKLLYGAGSAIVLAGILAAFGILHVAWLAQRDGTMVPSAIEDLSRYAIVVASPTILFAAAIGILWSMAIKQSLKALALAGFTVGVATIVMAWLVVFVCNWLNLGRFAWYTAAFLATIAVGLFFVARWMASKWLPTRTMSTWQQDNPFAVTKIESKGPSAFSRLLWLQRRQSLVFTVVVALVAAVFASVDDSFAHATLLLLVGFLGVMTFRPEHTEDRYRLLAQLGARAKDYWGSRLLFPLIGVSLAAVVLASQIRNRPESFDTWVMLICGCFAVFSLAQLCSIACKSTIIACALTLAGSIPMLAFLYYSQAVLLPIWFSIAMVLLPLAASYLRVARWFRGTGSWKQWVVPAIPMMLFIFGVPAAAIGFRIYEIPSVDLPKAMVQIASPTETQLRDGQQYEPILQRIGHNRFRFRESHLASPASFDHEFLNTMRDEGLQALSQDDAFVDSALELALSGTGVRHALGVDDRFITLSQIFLIRAQRAVAQDAADEAWDCYAATLNLTSLQNNGFSGFRGAFVGHRIESRVYGQLAEWASLESNSHELVSSAAQFINELRVRQTDWQTAMAGVYNSGEGYYSHDIAGIPYPNDVTTWLFRNFSILMPWEKTRANRFQDYCFATEHAYRALRKARAQPSRDHRRNRYARTTLGGVPFALSDTELDSFDNTENLRRGTIYQLASIAHYLEHGEYPTDFRKLRVGDEPLPDDLFAPGELMLKSAGNEIVSRRELGQIGRAGRYSKHIIPLPGDSVESAEVNPADLRSLDAFPLLEDVAPGSVDEQHASSRFDQRVQGSPKQTRIVERHDEGMTLRLRREDGYDAALAIALPDRDLGAVQLVIRAGNDTQRLKLIRHMNDFDPQWVGDVIPELTQLLETATPEVAGVVADAINRAITHAGSLTDSSATEWKNSQVLSDYVAVSAKDGRALGAPIKNPGNGHFYELIATDSEEETLENLKAVAADRRFRGMQGHLATITSAEENDFLGRVFQLTDDDGFITAESAWTGAIYDQESNEWKWADGPETDQVFWPNADGDSFSDWLYPSWLEFPDHDFRRMVWMRLESPKRWIPWTMGDRSPSVLIEYSPPLHEQ